MSKEAVVTVFKERGLTNYQIYKPPEDPWGERINFPALPEKTSYERNLNIGPVGKTVLNFHKNRLYWIGINWGVGYYYPKTLKSEGFSIPSDKIDELAQRLDFEIELYLRSEEYKKDEPFQWQQVYEQEGIRIPKEKVDELKQKIKDQEEDFRIKIEDDLIEQYGQPKLNIGGVYYWKYKGNLTIQLDSLFVIYYYSPFAPPKK